MSLEKNLAVIGTLVRLRVSRSLADAPSFWSAFFVDTTVFLVQAVVFWFVYLAADDPNGWYRWRSVFFVGTFTLVDGLYMTTYFFGLIKLPELVRTGELDVSLVQPVDPLVRIGFGSFDPGSILLALPALALIVVAASNLGLPITPGGIAAYLAAVVLMLVLMFDLMLLMRIPAFFAGRIDSLQAVENVLVGFSYQVPGWSYRGAARMVFRVFLPYGLIASFPAESFFGDSGPWLWPEAAVVTAAFTAAAIIAWRKGLRYYGSTGT
jgi:ABC-2 type transport system permease protein